MDMNEGSCPVVCSQCCLVIPLCHLLFFSPFLIFFSSSNSAQLEVGPQFIGSISSLKKKKPDGGLLDQERCVCGFPLIGSGRGISPKAGDRPLIEVG